MIPVRTGSRWMCVAAGQPKRTHTVISTAGGTVITWSDPSPNEGTHEGVESFKGSIEQFKQMFALCNGGKTEC